jgi:cobalt-zinc-cadmium efflux system protein
MAAWRSPHDTHQSFQLGKRDALVGAILLSCAAFVLQLAGAWYTGSLALFGDSAHLLTDLFSLVMSLAAVILACRPTTHGRSFGFFRLEVLASFVNGLLLLVVALGLVRESVLRVVTPEPVKVLPLIVVASVGLLFNLLSAWVLHRASLGHAHHGHSHDQDHDHDHDHGHAHDAKPAAMTFVKTEEKISLKQGCGHDHGPSLAEEHLHKDRNLDSALLHVLSDAVNSLAVIVGGVLMYFSHYYWVDAAVGFVIGLWILKWSWRVILDSGHVLLESTPRHVKVEAVIAEMVSTDQRVAGVDDLHVWELTSRMYAATAEVRVRSADLREAEALRQKMHKMLHDKFGIAHVVLAMKPE